MELLSPLYLLGALAVGVPILLHLVQREHKNRMPFASLMFMPREPIKQFRRRQLKHLLLLFLRCLGILLLIGAFARPVVTGDWLNRVNPLGSTSVLILIDNSLSMSREPNWSRALEAAEERIRELGDGDEAMVAQFGDSAEILSEWVQTPNELVQTLRARVSKSFSGTSYLEALRLAADQFDEDRNAGREILMITDLQRSALTSTQGWKVPPEISVDIRDVGEPSENTSIDEVRLEREVFGKSYPHSILVRLQGSEGTSRSGEAQLFLEGQVIARKPFELSDVGTSQLAFDPFEVDEGTTRGKIVIDGDDALPEDNSFFFVVERKAPRSIVIVTPRQGQKSLYLENALTTGENLPFTVQTVSRFSFDQISPADTPLIVFDGVRDLPSAASARRYLEAGGGIVLAMGNASRKEGISAEWDAMLPGKLVERRFVRSRRKPFTSITDVQWEHPIFSVFQDIHKAAVASTQFYSYWKIEPDAEDAVLASFDEGDPALAESRVGAGRLLVYTSSLNPVWTDFPRRSAFLPFWNQLVLYTANWQPVPASMRINQVIAAAGDADAAWSVLDPEGQRIVGLDDENPSSLRLTKPGHYEIRENKNTDWVAANTLSLESDLDRVNLEDLQAVFVPSQSRVRTDSEVPVTNKERQQSLWWLFLLAAAIVFLTEAWVANRQTVSGVLSNAES